MALRCDRSAYIIAAAATVVVVVLVVVFNIIRMWRYETEKDIVL